MAKKKVCKRCKMVVEGEKCPNCGSDQFSTSYQGRVYVIDPNSSSIANKIGAKAKGEYAIKVR